MYSKACIFLICMLMMFCGGEGKSKFKKVVSSTTKLHRLLKQERFVIQQLEEALEKTNEGKSTWARKPIQTYLQSYYNIFKEGKTEEEVVYHPVDTFHFIKHVTIGYQKLKRDMNNTEIYIVKEPLDVYLIAVMEGFMYHRTNVPPVVELERIGASIARMRAVYRISFNSLIQGKLQSSNTTVFQSSLPLDSWDCYTIGKGAVKHKLVDEGILWLTQAEKKCFIDFMVYEEEVVAVMKTAKEQMGKAEYTYPHAFTREEAALCRGETVKASLKNANLVCRYLNRGNAYLLIGPMKLEEKSRDPPIMVFHDFVFESEFEKFQKLTNNSLETSIIEVEAYGSLVERSAAFERTSDTAWVTDDEDVDFTHRLSRRIDAATNLDTGAHTSNNLASQPYQVVNYGAAGVDVTHTDFLEQVESDEWVQSGGDRIATILLYLTDVEIGGATVFPDAGVTIPAEGGSAAVWYNVRRNGAQDDLTRHCGCPVMYGSKWISNKWIMMYGQMFRQRCGLGESEKFSLP